MRVETTTGELAAVEADLHVLPQAEGDELPQALGEAAGAADVKHGFGKTTLLRPGGPERLLVVGLGKREELDDEKLRSAAAIATREAGRYDARSVAWSLADEALSAAAVIEGTILASYRFDRFRSRDEDDPAPVGVEVLTVALGDEADEAMSTAIRTAQVAAEAANRARELQNLPSNVLTPTALAERAEEIAAEHASVSVEVLGRSEIAAKKMGGLVAVSQGSAEDPRLIVLRYSGGGDGATLGLVGKAVTFDTGGISIKPSAGMQDMKMDMSGGAAVLEAVGAIAELGLGLDLIAVIPSTENMPSGTAIKPGDIITQYNGKTVEVNNTDAEGRLILADALAYCVELGAERVVDLATLTGAVLVALGSTYAALISNDDELAGEVAGAGERSGEIVWRLPLHAEYKKLTTGTVADLTNASDKRKAGTIYAGSFLEEFVDGKPWAHLDIAGTAWDIDREYAKRGPTGFGVRLLVDLASALAS
ncbi:MAG: leucyl aminopeptidase [Solirubrobacterales bacterium]|nr:leucyl aminopeptidase [Solirubrobacterales bacterium]